MRAAFLEINITLDFSVAPKCRLLPYIKESGMHLWTIDTKNWAKKIFSSVSKRRINSFFFLRLIFRRIYRCVRDWESKREQARMWIGDVCLCGWEPQRHCCYIVFKSFRYNLSAQTNLVNRNLWNQNYSQTSKCWVQASAMFVCMNDTATLLQHRRQRHCCYFSVMPFDNIHEHRKILTKEFL